MQVLERLGPIVHPDLLAGHRGFEDAGVFRIDADRALVQTVDFFPPVVDDATWFGRIAAANALSDVYAMGGTPLTVMNIVGWPRDLDLGLLADVLAGALDKTREAGAVLCGGHSVVSQEILFGLSVTGDVHPDRIWRNSGAQAGDALLLTKPLGMGAVSTAIKRDLADSATVDAAMALMATLNRGAAAAMADLDVHAATDVTGFGLVGHGCELASGAGLALDLCAAALPVFPGALELVRRGALSGGCARGKAHFGERVEVAPGVEPALVDLAFDAETSGGLLLALPEHQVDRAIAALRAAAVPSHAVIGRFVAADGRRPLLRLA